MKITTAQMTVFDERARARLVQEIAETWHIVAPKAYPEITPVLDDYVLRSLAAEVFDACKEHDVSARALITRLSLEVIRAVHLGLDSSYIKSMTQYFFDSEGAYMSALDWIDHVLENTARYMR